MPSKSLVMVAMVIGSSIGSYIPVLFGASFFSYISIFGSLVGGVAGIYLVFRLSN